jgi:FMN reductase
MAGMDRTTVVVGNPKPRSRTLEAAQIVAEELTGAPADAVVDIIDLGPGLLGWGDPAVAAALEQVTTSSVVVYACPTYKATFTGLLKLFLDQIPANGLAGTVGVPLMLGAAPNHALAPELLLKPVLVELGATCPTRGLYLLDSAYTNRESYSAWTQVAKEQVAAARRPAIA